MAAHRPKHRTTTNPPTLVWFRNDLRLEDNPALRAAVKAGGPVVPVYIWAPQEEGAWPPGAASKWWLHHSLDALTRELRARGSRLILRSGDSLETLLQCVRETGARAVFWNRRYEPAIRTRDSRIKEALRTEGLNAESFNAALLHEPWTIQNKSRKPFQVFTPFWRHCLTLPDLPAPLAAPASLPPPPTWPKSLPLSDLNLLPQPDWAAGLREVWKPGSSGAMACLRQFIKQAYSGYEDGRNRPDLHGTSRLSPHLHFGEISPRQIWHALARAFPDKSHWRQSQFLSELGWREFSHHLLFHFPETDTQPLRPEFARFRWRTNSEWLKAWQKGETGYPMVDAGMRELWTTGWMHNRVRMIVASFLVKDLLISWQEGARWFWDTLVDADLAQNTLGWQWTAGCGADAAPFFRIFNPTAQGEKFDPNGDYIRRWVPELSRLPPEWIHKPHSAPPSVLEWAKLAFPRDYPSPVVSHTIAREVALDAYQRIKKADYLAD